MRLLLDVHPFGSRPRVRHLPFAILLVLLSVCAEAQDLKDTYGKTNAQILAMGHDAWYDFYASKGGESTAAMSSIEGLYGDALMARNDRLIKRLKPALQGRYLRLRKAFQGLRNGLVTSGSTLSGGGTMWGPVANVLYKDSEQALYDALSGSAKAPSRVVSDVTHQFDLLRTATRKRAQENELDSGETKKALAALNDAEASYRTVVTVAKALPRKESDALLDACYRMLKGSLPVN